MTGSVSLLPPQTGWSLGSPEVADLTDDEQDLVTGLATKLMVQTPDVLQRWSYYDGEQRLQNLGISIPPQLAGVRTVVDWPRICCDPLVERAQLAGFRLPTATDIDTELAELWHVNDMETELPLAILDALVAGRGYLIVGSPDVPGEAPLVTVESPLNLAMMWDPRTKAGVAAFQAYQVEGVYRAVLYTPTQTISMSRTMTDPWAIDDRDEHNLGELPVVRLANRSRSSDREGRSQITPSVMNTTDSACRSLLGMEIAREVYSIPRLYVLGASEDSFMDAAGQPKSGLSMAMTRMLAFDRDEEGELPQVGQLATYDPAVFTKMVDKYAQLMSSYTGFPPSYFGQTTTANPSSADAIRVAENAIDRGGLRVQRGATAALRKTAQLMWRFANGVAELPEQLTRLQVDWVDPSTPTPAATSDAIAKQISVGAIPAISDVTLEKLGYTAVERARLAQDRAEDPTAQLLASLDKNVAGKDILAALRLLKSTGQMPPTDVAPIDPAAAPAAAPPAQAGR